MNKFKKYFLTRFNILLGKSLIIESVIIETTGACTNRCYMCLGRSGIKKRKYIPDDIFEKVINRLSDFNYSGQIYFFGQNEPILDKNIFERLNYASKKLPNARIIFISNFTFLNDEVIKKLLDAPISRLTNSIYALDSTSYQKICGRDNFNSAVTNLINFSKEWAKKKPYDFTIYCIKSEYNKHDIDFIEYLLDKFPCSAGVQTYMLNTRNIIKRSNNPWFFSPFLYSTIKITGDGDMPICSFDPDSKLLVGNIINDNLKEAINNNIAIKIRNDIFYGRTDIGNEFCNVFDSAQEHKM